MLIIRGRNRVNLLAEVAYFPFHKNYNILGSHSFVTEGINPKQFSIGFVFDTYLEELQQQELENQIKQCVRDIFEITFCDRRMIFNR
jgi:formyltetrahydrofolate hydrolase